IDAGEIPAVVLVRDGAVIPHIQLAQSTAFMDWSNVELAVYAADKQTAAGLVCLPSDQKLYTLEVSREKDQLCLTENPLFEKVNWTIRQASQ
ncbi:MAG: alpha-xylosidase, partial [Phycisphaerae bacterium]|nr:alpha-xylosidase [Phycisphaerae bacterium]